MEFLGFRGDNLFLQLGHRKGLSMCATIQLTVDEQTAQAFAAASPEQQRKLQLLLRLRLKELTEFPSRSIDQLMDDIGSRAAALGLTAEALESMLDAD